MSSPVTKFRNCLKTCYICIQQNQRHYIQWPQDDLTSDMRACSPLFSLNIAWLVSMFADALIMDYSNTCPTSQYRTLYLDAYKLVHALDSQLSMHKKSSTFHFFSKWFLGNWLRLNLSPLSAGVPHRLLSCMSYQLRKFLI